MTFWLKKLILELFYPVPVCILLLAAGCGLLWFTRRQRCGKVLVSVATVLLLLLSLPLLPRMVLQALEPDYPAVLHPVRRLEEETGGGLPSGGAWTVVAGTGFNAGPEYPFTLRASPVFWKRLLEGARICRSLPRGRLLVCVSGAGSDAQKREFLRESADLLGLDPDRVRLIADARTTAREASLAADVVGGAPFFLVSEALHLRRAVEVFRSRGLRAIPAPSGYAAPEGGSFPVLAWFPSSGNLGRARRAIHESLGLMWGWLRRRVRTWIPENDASASAAYGRSHCGMDRCIDFSEDPMAVRPRHLLTMVTADG